MNNDQAKNFYDRAQRFTQAVMEGVRQGGLFPGELVVMRTVCESRENRTTPTAISRLMAVRPPTISPIIARLERQGLLLRIHGQTDRRKIYLQATPAGEKAYELAYRQMMAYYQVLIRRLEPEELDLFLKLLEKISPPTFTEEDPPCSNC